MQGEADFFEFKPWRQVRGPAGAVFGETRDFGIKWPCWHTVIFEEQVALEMRVVCQQDVKNMLLRQAKTVYWKKWAAKHDPIQAMLRRKTK